MLSLTSTDTTAAALEQLLEIAGTAGERIMECYDGAVAVTNKDDGSPLTAADRTAHDCIVHALGTWTPGVPVISEEGSIAPYEERRDWERFWLVDPLDGTKEFIKRNGEFTVNIALIEHGRPVLGVVGAPAIDTIYFAAEGRGAWRRVGEGPTERIYEGRAANGVTRIVESRSHPSPELEAYIATLGPVERIQVGSSLKFCRVAEGSADQYPRFGRTMEWDVAAGDCVYRNSGAGGRERPSPLRYNQPGLATARFIIGA